MTEATASAGFAHADATSHSAVARLGWSVRAAIDDDWLIFLDVARNRYRAVKRHAAPPIAGVCAGEEAPDDQMSAWRALAQAGLIARPPGRSLSLRPTEHTDAAFGDVLALARIAIWSRHIVRRGALLEAFGTLSALKAQIAINDDDRDRAVSAYAKFAAARIWIPARYVCLFDSLCLMRVLLARRISADLVFGVRGRPFAAHCWVECEGEILDDGGETCSSFVEIVRV